MEFEQIEAFLTVARTKNFTRAAEELNVVQSTITARIKMLEKSIGKELFKRKTRSVEITPSGQSFYPYAEQIMDLVQGGITAARLQPFFESKLVIGGLNSIWDSSLFTTLYEFHKNHKEIAMRIITDHSDHISQRIQQGTVDIGLVYSPPKSASFEVIPLMEESLQLVGSQKLAIQIGAVQCHKLLHLPLIHYNWGPPFTEWFEHEVGNHDSAAFRVDHTGVAVRLLLQGEGIGFLLDSIANEYIKDGQLKLIPLNSKLPVPKRKVYMILSKKDVGLSKIKSFLEYFLKRYIE